MDAGKTLTDRRVVRVVVRGVPLVLLAIAGAAMAERIAPLRMLDVYLVNNPALATGLGLVTLNLVAVGLLLVIAVHFMMSAEGENQSGQPVVQLLPVYRRGRMVRPQMPVDALSDRDSPQTLPELWKAGYNRLPPDQRRLFVLRLGGLCLLVGVAGFAFLIGPASVRSVIAVSVVYVMGWLGWALARDA